jgi:hypothetical protein
LARRKNKISMNKLNFLTDEFTLILSAMDATMQPRFGKMNFQQMVEHMSYAFRQASGLIPFDYKQEERITKLSYQFMMSEKPFKDNTPNVLLPYEPFPLQHLNPEVAIDALQKEIDTFVSTFQNQPSLRLPNPFFGLLNFEEWIQLLHKHSLHHLRQFGFE